MKIDVQLLGYLARFSPTEKEKFQLDLEPEATVAHILEKIGFPADLQKMILVNGVQAKLSTVLAEGDDVFIFAPALGG